MRSRRDSAVIFINVDAVISTDKSIKNAKIYGKPSKPEYIDLPKDKVNLLHRIDVGYRNPRILLFGNWDNKLCLNNFISKTKFWRTEVDILSSYADSPECVYADSSALINNYLSKAEEDTGTTPDFLILGNDRDDEALKKEFDLRCILVSIHTGLTLEDVNRANYILSLTN